MTGTTHWCLNRQRNITLPLGHRCEYCNWSSNSHSPTPDPGMLATNFLMVNPESSGWPGWDTINSATTSSPHDSLYSFPPEFTDDPPQPWMPDNGFAVDQSSYPAVSRSQSQRDRHLSVPQEHQIPMTQTRLSTSYPGANPFPGRDDDDNALFPTQSVMYAAEHLHVPRQEFEPSETELRPTRRSQPEQTNSQYVSSRPRRRPRARQANAHKRRRRNRVACSYCPNTFSRQADVDRHVDTVHNREQRQRQGNLLDCPWPGCHRKGNRAFARKDHWLEHRRNYHNEIIPKRRSRSRGSRHSGASDDVGRMAN